MRAYNFDVDETIALPITSASGYNVITVIDGNARRVAQECGILKERWKCNIHLTELWCMSNIKSLPEMQIPQILDSDNDYQRQIKALDAEWKSPRKQLSTWLAAKGGQYRRTGSFSLLNTSGYPYRKGRLLDLITDALSGRLGEGSKLGISLDNVGTGGLQATDELTIHGSVTYSFVLFSEDMPYIPPPNQSNAVKPTLNTINATQSVGTTSAVIIAASTETLGWIISNTSAENIFLSFGAADASPTSPHKIEPGGKYYSDPFNYTLDVRAVSTATTVTIQTEIFT